MNASRSIVGVMTLIFAVYIIYLAVFNYLADGKWTEPSAVLFVEGRVPHVLKLTPRHHPKHI